MDLGSTVTFEAGGIRLRGRRGIQQADGEAASTAELSDLERVKLLGQGASSKVWLCRDKRTGMALALKQLPAFADPATRRMAVNELKLAQKTMGTHPHIMRFIDAYFDEGAVLILMELADAGSLDDAIRKSEGVPERVLRSAILQLLRGLTHMHVALKHVHRDLKPANVMLTRRGLVKVADFGLSRELDASGSGQLAMTQCGTTAYMSPERLNGEAYDAKSDVWSVGIIVLEALRGSPPFEGARGFIEQAELISSGGLLPPPSDTSRETLEFMARCLRSRPVDRLDTVGLLQSTWMQCEADSGEAAERTLANWLYLLVLWGPGSDGEKLSKQAARSEGLTDSQSSAGSLSNVV